MKDWEQVQKCVKESIIILPINKTQTYAWGSKDKTCKVGMMAELNHQCFAQFWMGTHPSGESKLTPTLSLKDFLRANGMSDLEFLFKILSIEKCLSIQVHPNQDEAKELNKLYPTVYVDDKDKPEMFLTLSEKFQLFLGFINEKQFSQLLEKQPFKKLSNQINTTSYKQRLIALLQKIVELQQTDMKEYIDSLFANISAFSQEREQILTRLFKQFEYDAGLLVSCLLQYHNLQKGECFGIPAGVPHAYIRGECLQLMKSSDNVVRLGLTPKQKDIPNLLKIVKNNFQKTYRQVQPVNTAQIQRFQWNSLAITRMTLNQNLKSFQVDNNSIGLIMQGNAIIKNSSIHGEIDRIIQEKTVFFVKKGVYQLKGSGQIIFASKL